MQDLRYNIIFRTRHIPGINNTRADCLSRFQIAPFKELSPRADELPTIVPEILMPKSSVLVPGSGHSYRERGHYFANFTRNFTRQKAFHLPLTSASLALLFLFSTVGIFRLRLFFLIYRPLVTSTRWKVCMTPRRLFFFFHSFIGRSSSDIQKLLTSLSRQKSCDVKLPISKPILHDLVSSLQHTNSSAAQRILFSAMFLTAFYGFFRIGELAARSACHTTVIPYDNS